MKKLLVVGDSFMHPDKNYPGEHWSEMLPEYDIIMRSISGSSNGIIAYQFFEGLKCNPDAVVMGFTMPDRIEFLIPPGSAYHNRKWYSSGNSQLNSDQRLAADMFRATTCDQMNLFKSCVIARCMLVECVQRKIPFAYTLNGLFNNLVSLPYPSDPTVISMLGEFSSRMCINLATYPDFKTSPGFHTDDPAWQNRMADEVRHILSTVDFC
jgi:hypothetical protein